MNSAYDSLARCTSNLNSSRVGGAKARRRWLAGDNPAASDSKPNAPE